MEVVVDIAQVEVARVEVYESVEKNVGRVRAKLLAFPKVFILDATYDLT